MFCITEIPHRPASMTIFLIKMINDVFNVWLHKRKTIYVDPKHEAR